MYVCCLYNYKGRDEKRATRDSKTQSQELVSEDFNQNEPSGQSRAVPVPSRPVPNPNGILPFFSQRKKV